MGRIYWFTSKMRPRHGTWLSPAPAGDDPVEMSLSRRRTTTLDIRLHISGRDFSFRLGRIKHDF